MNVSNNSKVNLNDLIRRVEREGNSTGITGKTFGDLVAYANNSNKNIHGTYVGSHMYTVFRDTGIGTYSSDGVNGTVVSNDGSFIKNIKKK